MITPNNRKWLIIIGVVLLGLFILIIMGMPQSAESERIGGSVSDTLDRTRDRNQDFRTDAIEDSDDTTQSR